MRILITGLRGVGKSHVRGVLAEKFGWPSRSVGDFMEQYCLQHFPGITREEMMRTLTIPKQLEVSYHLVNEIQQYPQLFLEAQSVIAEEFGMMIPVQPVFRKVKFDGIFLLEAAPQSLVNRRRLDVKRRLPRFLSEKVDALAEQQGINRSYIVAFGVHLGINTFIIKNDGNIPETVTKCLEALDMQSRPRKIGQPLK